MFAPNCLTWVLALLLLGNIHLVISDNVCRVPPTIQLAVGSCIILSTNQSDVHSWGVKIGVQNANEICAVPSTVVNSTFLTSSELCNDDQLGMHGLQWSREQCRSRRGGFIDKHKVPSASIDGLAELNPEWGALDNNITEAVNATLQLGRHSITTVAALFSDGNVSTSSHLGLAAGSTLLHDLKENGLIGSNSWGLNAGSKSLQSPRAGSLVLGGFDEASIAGSFFEYGVKSPDKLENRYCPLQVLVTGLAITAKGANMTKPVSRTFVSNANKWMACIEPYDNLFRMPGPVLDQFQTLFQETTGYSSNHVRPSDYHDGLLNIEAGMVYPTSLEQFNASLRLTLNYNLTIDIPWYEFQRPLRGLNAGGDVAIDTNFTEYMIFEVPAEGDAPVLGKAFLSQLYLYVNYDIMKFYLAAQNPEVRAPSPTSFESLDCRSTSDHTLATSTMAQALIAVISALAAVMLAIAAIWLYRRIKRRSGLDTGLGPNESRGMEMPTEGHRASPTITSDGYDDHRHERDTASSPTEHPPTDIYNEMSDSAYPFQGRL